MKIKTSELTGPALDWVVAKCEGLNVYAPPFAEKPWLQVRGESGFTYLCPVYCADWAHGGPIIEREGICIFLRSPHWPRHARWSARQENDASLGPTPLIAAMRCYVASKLGDTVEVPEELL